MDQDERMAAAPFDARKDTLYGLIRELYRRKRAAAMIEAFEASLMAHDETERGNILHYWIDFYRLRRYQRDRQRRRPLFRERIVPCAACGYPASQRHHLWNIAAHGENKVTIQLCANCHELEHLIYNALVKDSEHSRRLVLHIAASGKVASETVEKLIGWCQATIRYEASNGWVDGERASPRWVEVKFGDLG
ncbi:MAG: hypothetical protein SGI73_04805 [Chloroflexota bacterium]|nr:hypothetical protein [Chloroflexota bacterium]